MATNNRLERVVNAPRWLIVVCVAVVMSLAGALGVVRAANNQMAMVHHNTAVASALMPITNGVENFLLVGSDTRASADPSDPDYKAVGSAGATPGQRSDSLIVVRYDTKKGTVATMSVPRDLWTRIAGQKDSNRINSAYEQGADVLVHTIESTLNIPINHYVEVDFSGFKKIVDAISGVTVCVAHPARDKSTGLYIPHKGCTVLRGTMALAFARSRHYEYKQDGTWHTDGSSDIGRTIRQRAFISDLAASATHYLTQHPLQAHSVITAFTSALTTDPGLQLLDLARKLKPLAKGGSSSITLPVVNAYVGTKSVLRLAPEAQAVLAYFSGLGPMPAIETTRNDGN